ncbi:E3 ubiquitin-protein ligase Midline-1-like isoform X1 [Cygnus olor]|uniref:E3 ubiquitin-protein ligase Midline-1-like isoform X1 n=1 Tax=Cygnus olor TaxID=8869 RepID=UPI001ADE93B1|nr:E3 ubiquitin-protein ligase Midline-1-like isoform X1 [Cygnus olor]
MEALREALLCPVCLELFTPPVLVLSCAHNFCKQCLEKILIHQNCHHVNGHFHCPLCRKMCLTDDKPICAICKLFGKHKDHNIAKVSEAYQGRKNEFIKKLHLVHKKSEDARKESEKLINELTADATDTKVMIDTVGTGLLKGILYRTAELHSKLHNDYSTKLETLQVISKEAEAPRQLYHQMETLLEQHVNSVQFLQEDKKLKEKIEKMLEGKASYQDPPTYKISVKQYFEELIKGINIKDYLSSACQEMLTSTTDIAETCRSEYPAFVFSGQSPDQSFYKQVLQLFEKSNDVNQDILKM